MNTTAYDIYQELMVLPESKLVEVKQFVEFIKFKQQQLSETEYILNNQNLMNQIRAAEQSQWFMPSKNQLNLDEE